MDDELSLFTNGMVELDPADDKTMQRRDLFKGAGTVAAWLAAANLSAAQTPSASGKVPEAKPGSVLPVVPFGKHRITRLIAGANPIYGYSHFNYLFSAHMGEYHTTERVLSFLNELERGGLNTWQASWSERLETDWLKYKEQGGKLQLLVLSRPDFNDRPEILERVMKLKPMGIAQHGVSTNRFWDAGQFDQCKDYLKRIRDTGAMVGLSCHNPLEVEYSEEKGWDVDYYMTSLYYMIRPRAAVRENSRPGTAGRNLSSFRPASHDANHPQGQKTVPGVQSPGGWTVGQFPQGSEGTDGGRAGRHQAH